MTKEEIEEIIMESLDWKNIPLGSYVVRIAEYEIEHEVELLEIEKV